MYIPDLLLDLTPFRARLTSPRSVIVQSAGDLWYFPPGIPHSLQATDDDPDGTEFLLVRSLYHASVFPGSAAAR